jgi:ABC-type polysaccharide/polyol phosphate export permease
MSTLRKPRLAGPSPVDEFLANGSKFASLSHAWSDISTALGMWRAWTLLGWRDFKLQTSRTLLGPLWGVIGTVVTVTLLGFVYGSMSQFGDFNAFVFLAAGFIAWFFISGCIIGGAAVYISAAGVLTERNIPIFFPILRYFFRMFVEFLIKFTTYFLVCAVTLYNPGPSFLLLFPALLLYAFNGLWVLTFFAIIGARFRDAIQIISPLMLIVFLATPILWPESSLIKNGLLVAANPFSYFIDVLRDPMLGRVPEFKDYAVTVIVGIFGWALAFIAFARSKNRLVFWL